MGGRAIARHLGGEKCFHAAAFAEKLPAFLALVRHLASFQDNLGGIVVKILAHLGKALPPGLAFDRANVEIAVRNFQSGGPTIVGGGLQFGDRVRDLVGGSGVGGLGGDGDEQRCRHCERKFHEFHRFITFLNLLSFHG